MGPRQFPLDTVGVGIDYGKKHREQCPYIYFFRVIGYFYTFYRLYFSIFHVGIKIKRTRIAILFCTGLLTATTTAFCGPISFIGLAVPHIARLMLGSSNHKMLVPVTMLAGSCIALLCNILMVMPGTNNILPLNAVTPMLGAPVIIYVIVNRKNIQYFD